MARRGPARTGRGVIPAFSSIATAILLYFKIVAGYRPLTVIASNLVVPASSRPAELMWWIVLA
jgi:hypothetical protein